MSDLDDLRKLQEQLDSGQISAEEYASERAWITGSIADDHGSGTVTPRTTTGGHVIDLHEIEEAQAAPSHVSPASVHPDKGTRSDHNPPRKRIPTVWKAILIAFAVWILLLATAVVYLRLRNTGAQPAVTSADLQSTAGAQTQQGSETAQSAAQEIQAATAEASYETFVNELESILGTYYGDAYTVTDDGTTLTVSLMGDGIAADAMYVVQGANGAAEIWSELKVSMQTLAVTCYNGANAEAPERHVTLNILNDQNPENVILSYLDGTCIYDATETSDLSE